MKKNVVLLIVFMLLVQAIRISDVYAEKNQSIKLLKPQTEGGKPLMQALTDRKSSRSYSSKELPEQVLSNLLWAAFGINRPKSGKRTAPSAVNCQDIDIYVATARGLYLYGAKEHELIPVLDEDIRKRTGSQGFVKDAPVNLVFVSNYSRMKILLTKKDFYSAINTGYISQNVYLFCASEGLGTVARGLVNKKKLAKVMKLKRNQKVILSQTVGYIK